MNAMRLWRLHIEIKEFYRLCIRFSSQKVWKKCILGIKVENLVNLNPFWNCSLQTEIVDYQFGIMSCHWDYFMMKLHIFSMVLEGLAEN